MRKTRSCVYPIAVNVGGDGKDVWPWTGAQQRLRFDCSKLDRSEILLSHMTRKGLFLYMLTQETENDLLLDGGSLGRERRAYYRERIVRFGCHPAVIWNLGEENTNTAARLKGFSTFFGDNDGIPGSAVLRRSFLQFPRKKFPLAGSLGYKASAGW